MTSSSYFEAETSKKIRLENSRGQAPIHKIASPVLGRNDLARMPWAAD